MRLEEDIEETATRVCDAMAGAIELYANVSGSGVDDLPEHFVAAYVLATLGSVLTMTMETNSGKLWEWGWDIRRRWDRLPVGHPAPAPADFIRTVGGRRADLVLFKGDHSRKNETDFLCIVEFKKEGDPEPDVQGIREWFQFIDTCPWGMVCSFVNTKSVDWLRIIRDRAASAGDKFIEGRVARPLSARENFQTLARILKNTNYKAPAG